MAIEFYMKQIIKFYVGFKNGSKQILFYIKLFIAV